MLISGVSFRDRSLSQSHESDIFSYFECKVAKFFRSFVPGPHWRERQRQRHTERQREGEGERQRVKSQHPPKIAGYGIDLICLTISKKDS